MADKRCRSCRCCGIVFTVLFAILGIYIVIQLLFPATPNWKKTGEDGLPVPVVHKPENDINLTETERSAFTEFKERVSSKITQEHYLKYDVFLVKWLRAANFDVEEADKFLTENLQWKKDENIGTIHDEDWSDLSDDYQYNVDGVDHLGRPVLFMNLGAWNIKAATKSGKKEHLERFITKMLDEAVKLVYQKYESDRKVTQYFILADLYDFSYFQGACVNCISVYLTLARVFEQKYPGMGYQIVTINTPGVFSIVFNLIKPVLSETTREHCYLMGDREEWEPFLLEQMDRNQLPAHLREEID